MSPVGNPLEKTQKIKSLIPKTFKFLYPLYPWMIPKDNWVHDQKDRLKAASTAYSV